MAHEAFSEKYWNAWERRDWDFVEGVLTEDFTFTSPRDDHISKHAFKAQCWDTLGSIEMVDIEIIADGATELYMRYKAKVDGESVHNIEHFMFQDGKVTSITVFFGLPSV